MPKAAATSKNPTVPPQRAARRSMGAARPLMQPVATLPETEDSDVRPRLHRSTNGRITRLPKAAKQDDTEEDFDKDHPECLEAIRDAEETNRRLTTRLNAQRREATASAQRLSRERKEMAVKNQQYRSEIQKQSNELQRLNEEVSRLQRLLDAANSDAHNLVQRTELQRILEGIHAAGRTFMGHIKSQVDENQNAQDLTELPGINMTGDWLAIPEFDDDAGFAEMPDSVFPPPAPGDI
ncbi:hypothetical protein N7509_000084 [Penicillium cosmopolitanum]|uniref:Uncharacterized protein n=1 Tax=Penicillium cosmopolitanum TaxID=1131564 RepID=A0A9W9WCQ6_9EURO|nr:uncharacterized protein N7509_000084 [Penicillium cosmopolitanum]KAJ5414986.1 hypothetical protein N7509_000084 [Penicillium cosmopolitanum]